MDKKFLIFIASNQEYAIDIAYVKEVIKKTEINALPQVPEAVKGIINHRGKTLHIFEVSKLLGQKNIANIEQKKIIIINIKDLNFGFLVDDVLEVITIKEEQIETPKDVIAKNFDAIFFNGIIKNEAEIIYLLNIENIIQQKKLLPNLTY